MAIDCIKKGVSPHRSLAQSLVNLSLANTEKSHDTDLVQNMLKLSSQQKGSGKELHEMLMLWAVKFNRLQKGTEDLPQ